jgi:teichuronic acid biosynthesis glycosyltransferase TuaG
MGSPQFSVILPTYNGESTLGRAVQSVRSQTDPDWELVAVDDGSTDGSLDILQDAARSDDRVRVFRMANSGGPARPRNRAVAEATGRAICLLDQDDYWLPDKLERQRPLIGRPDVGIVYGDAWIEEVGHERRLYSEVWGKPHNGQVVGELINSNFVPALTAVVPTEVARVIGPLDERFLGVDDYHWWLRIAMSGYRVVSVAAPVSVYCVSDSNLSHDHDLYLGALDQCLKDLGRLHPLWRRSISERREELRRHSFDYFANRLARNGLDGFDAARTAAKVATLTRTWPEAKRAIASAIPPQLRPRRGSTA